MFADNAEFRRRFGDVRMPKPQPDKKKLACADVHFYALRLREDRQRENQKLKVDIWDYIPTARVHMLEMALSPAWNVKDAEAIAFLVKGEKLEAWDAVLLPDSTFLLLLPEGEGNSLVETSGDKDIREKWIVMDCPGVPFDVTVCGADDAKAAEWIELYFGDINENQRKSR